MKKLFFLFFLSLSILVYSQNSTDSFSIKGKIKNEIIISLSDLQSSQSKPINDVVITNHLGEVKYTAKGLKGVLLKDIFSKVEFDSESPKVLSEFYLTFVANDNYKVVFSWNEIFNSPAGDNLYIVTSKDGKELKYMPDRILIMCTTDFKTGRRFVKGLKEIIVQRIP